MADLIFWLAVACCVVAQVAIVRAALKAPPPGARGAEPGAEVPRPRRASEIAWTILPALGLAIVLFATWRAIHPSAAEPAAAVPPALHVDS